MEIPESGRISIEDYNREIDEALAEMKKEEFYTHEQLAEMSQPWYFVIK